MDKGKFLVFSFLLLYCVSLVAGAQGFVYPDEQQSSGFDSQEWFNAPEYDSQQELIFQILAPFAFVTILLQFSLKKALEMSFAQDSSNPYKMKKNKPDVHKESTVMALAISAMLVASPYWSLLRNMAAGIGLLSVGILGVVLLYLIYLFLSGAD